MIEIEIAENLIDGYIELKKQNKQALGLGINTKSEELENCNYKLLEKYINKKGYKMYFEKIDKSNFLFITPNP